MAQIFFMCNVLYVPLLPISVDDAVNLSFFYNYFYFALYIHCNWWLLSCDELHLVFVYLSFIITLVEGAEEGGRDRKSGQDKNIINCYSLMYDSTFCVPSFLQLLHLFTSAPLLLP